jgi:hypothetical protein
MFLVVFVLGWITNLLAIPVLQDRVYRGTSTGFLMTALALADIGVVSTSAAHIWIIGVLHYDIRICSVWICKCHTFMTYLTVHISAWTLALVAVERAVCVCMPFRYKIVFSFRRAVIVWGITTALLAGINSHILWIVSIVDDEISGERRCGSIEKFKLYGNGLDILDLLLASIIPFMVILPCNIIIMIKILERRLLKKSRGVEVSRDSRPVSSTTVMLVVNCVAFLLLTAPIAILSASPGVSTILRENTETVNFFLWLFHLLFNTNSCVNFFLYCVSSSKFRNALTRCATPKLNERNSRTRYHTDH